MHPNPILALDLGKFNTVLCWYEPDTRAACFRTVATTPDDLRRERLRQPGVTVVCEACSQAGWVDDLAGELGLAITATSTSKLRPGGRLVAVVANGPRQRERLLSVASAWIDLPAGSFQEQGTDVNAAIVVIQT
jgi:hypothetical protein